MTPLHEWQRANAIFDEAVRVPIRDQRRFDDLMREFRSISSKWESK